jgi:hypothetical protein
MIETETWQDDFFTELSMFERLLWLGIITGCPDDQGRLQDNVRLIHSKLFPLDNMDDATVEQALKSFAKKNKILRYTAEGKKLIQIINWWDHQSLRWAGKSNYPAPPMWIDRIHYHSLNNVIVEHNWKLKGGFPESYKAPIIAPITITDVDGDVNDDVKGEGEGYDKTPPAPIIVNSFAIGEMYHVRVFSAVTGMPGIPGGDMPKVLAAMDALRPHHPDEQEFIAYLKKYYDDWLKRKGKDGRPYSKANCAWLFDLAVAGETTNAELAEKKKQAEQAKLTAQIQERNVPQDTGVTFEEYKKLKEEKK